MVGARGIRSKKLWEHQYREAYARTLEGKGVEWDGDDNVKHMCEQVKQAVVESAREVCGSVRVGERTQRVWWNDEIKAAIRRNELLVVSDEETKERCMEEYREEKRKVRRGVYQSKKKVNEHFGREMNEDVNGNRKLFWKEVSNVKGGELQQSKGWKWEAGTEGGRSEKDLEGVFFKICIV